MKKTYTLLTIALAIFTFGCTNTIRPKPVVSRLPSFDGTNMHSGIIDYDDDGSVIITQRAYDQYNLLIDIYGKTFLPPLTPSYGAEVWTNKTYRLTPEAIFNLGKMKRMHKERD